MPREIAELPALSRQKEKKYDFSELFDGKTYVLVKGEDFDCEVQSIRQHLYREVNDAKPGHTIKSRQMEVDGNEALGFTVVKATRSSKNGAKASDKSEGKAESASK